jgi:aspartyl-tRNA(Asn)/glutamyl-tRNA(Gln) amidotransferase subunit B
VQETRLWDSERRVTFTMRTKEEAGEYRYFPDPDLPLVQLSETRVEEIKNALPELPDAKQERYQQEHGLSSYDAGVLIASRETAEFFEETLAEGADPKLACNWIMGDLTRVMNESGCGLRDSGIAPAQLAELTELLRKGEISSKIAKSVFEEMRNSGKAPAQIVEEKGLKQVSDTDKLGRLATELIAANPEQVEQYRAGKTKVLGFFVGQMMKQTKGQGNPQLINQLLRERLDA